MKKTILATAIGAAFIVLAAGSANATVIDRDFITGTEGSTKFVDSSNTDGTLEIKTDSDARKFLSELSAASSLDEIRAALAQIDEDGHAVLMGVAGGINYLDSKTYSSLKLASAFLSDHPDLQNIITKLLNQTESLNKNVDISSDTNIIVGGKLADGSTVNPLIVGLTGADNLLNLNLKILTSQPNATINRVGSTSIIAESGNLVGVIGGSLGLNSQGITASASGLTLSTEAVSTSTTITGDTTISLKGTTSALGVIAGSAALSLGGTSTANIDGNTTLTLSGNAKAQGFEGITIGAFGGGLAASTMDGTAATTVTGTTTVNINSGISLGVFGAGSALAAEFDGIWYRITPLLGDYAEKFGFGENNELLHLGGTATATSGDVIVNVATTATTAGTIGGGFVWANSGASTSHDTAAVNAKSVTLTLGNANDSFQLSDADKSKLHEGGKELITTLRSALGGSDFSYDTLQDAIDGVNVAGAHVGNVGGSIVLARTSNGAQTDFSAEASSNIQTVVMNLAGGYNAFNLAGGLTIAMDGNGLASEETPISATSNIDSTTVIISGGENVMVMGGGASYATASKGQDSKVLSSSTVTNVNMAVTGGSVDGIYGGGLAIDDTNASESNAKANVINVVISVQGGEVNAANTDPLTEIAKGTTEDGVPTNGAYVNDTAVLLSTKNGGGNVAILGGGIATGADAQANADSVTIELAGGKVTGNVFGGGAATFGGDAVTKDVKITVAGSEVSGSIYAGGLAGSPRNEDFAEDATYYKDATASVENAVITLASGTVTGNLYAGGYLYENSTSAKAAVQNADITIYDDVFQGKQIVGDGADKASLTIIAERDFTIAGEGDAEDSYVLVTGFDTLTTVGSVQGIDYSVGEKTATTVNGDPIAFNTLTIADGQTVTIGSADTAGYASAVELDNTGKLLVTKGAYGAGSSDAAQLARDAYANAGAEAALYVTGTVNLTGTILVGNTTADSGIAIGSNGILIANAAGNTAVTGTIALSDNGIYFTNVGLDLAEGQETQIVKIDGASEDTAFKTDNLLWSADYSTQDDTIVLHIKTADELSAIGLNDFDVIDFYNALDADSPLRARIAEGSYRGQANLKAGMNLAAAAGVQMAAIQSTMMGIDTATRRASLTETRLASQHGVTGFAEVTGSYLEMGGSSDMNEMKAELGGIVFGGEWSNNDITAGVLANLGSGTVRGQGANSGVKNELDYYGFAAYAGKRFGDFNIVGQIGYVQTDNDLKDSSVGYAKANGVDADVWTIGVRGEMQYALSEKCKAVPYIGLNYMRVSTDSYTASNGVHVSDTDQDLWAVPVGVAFTGTLATASGWNWTPQVDVAYIGVFGDRDVRAVTTSGTATGSVEMDVWTESAGRARLAIEASKNAFAVGAAAGMTFGSDDTTGFNGQVYVRYAF